MFAGPQVRVAEVTHEEESQTFPRFGVRRSVDERTKQCGRDFQTYGPFVKAKLALAFEENEHSIKSRDIYAIFIQLRAYVREVALDARLQKSTTGESGVKSGLVEYAVNGLGGGHQLSNERCPTVRIEELEIQASLPPFSQGWRRRTPVYHSFAQNVAEIVERP